MNNFLSHLIKKMYFIIATRLYAYYDGSRFMHMYFIPMLSRFVEDMTSVVLALLTVVVRYRMIFLKERSEFSVRKFRVATFDANLFSDMIRKYLRQFLLIEDESHVYQLDEPSRYLEFCGDGADPDQASAAFATWKDRRKKLIKLANKVQRELGTADNPTKLMKCWVDELQSFDEYVGPVNVNLGVLASKRLESWFETGKIEGPATPPQARVATWTTTEASSIATNAGAAQTSTAPGTP